MAYRELNVVEMKEILRLWSLGHGYRTVARLTSADRKTVRRYVDAATDAGFQRGEAVDDDLLIAVVDRIRPGAPVVVGEMRMHLRKHSEMILGWVKEGCHGPKIARLVHRTTGVPVPLRTLQRFLEEDLGVERGSRSTVRIADPAPGRELEVDFLTLGDFVDMDGRTRAMHALLCTAVFSRYAFLWPCLRETQEDVIEGLEAAWDFFGGVFPVAIPDNTKAIVQVADPVSPVFNAAFVEYSQARDFQIDPTRARKPKDKARVERNVRYVRDDFFKGENFRSVDEARIAARRWSNETAGMRVHGQTGLHPREVFLAEEKHLLLAAPEAPYDQPRWSDHTVGRDHALTVNYALYSIPHTLKEGSHLRVRSDRQTVKVYCRGKLVKVHPRQPRGGTRIDAADLPPDKVALATRDTTTLCEQAESFGPHVGDYARRLAEGPLPWSRIRHVYRLLGLARRFGPDATDEACARALELDVVDVRRIQGMLEKGLVTRRLLTSSPPPRPSPGKVLRFARDPREFSTRGGPDAQS